MTRRQDRQKSKRRNGSRDRRAGLAVALAGICLLGAAALYRAAIGAGTPPRIGGDYVLVNDQGRIVSQDSFHGRYTLVYFGYTHCVDVCPLTLSTVTAALARLGPRQDDIVPLFVSVDPQRDTPAALHRYVAAFSPRIVGLTGNAADIDHMLAEFRAMARRHPDARAPDGYLMDHSSVLYLMDGDNRLVSLFPVDADAGEIAARLRRLLPPAS
ncbi:SCO family protein [Nguyenibacter vanlangensis]|uniref:SCO family protein n=1 Tax=Nguyenibacter vanlangensis TaxID=1216886 RepID=A0A7Y7M8Y7_9PROT|nr:SCO family protein [Nguyenibacter vanlangensis]NVN12698.1 SCO family protein [Nguyenibacter vanlangensis]